MIPYDAVHTPVLCLFTFQGHLPMAAVHARSGLRAGRLPLSVLVRPSGSGPRLPPVLPSRASILPASSFPSFLFARSPTRPFRPSSHGLWLQVQSALLAGFCVSREAQLWGLRRHWDNSQADCAFPRGGCGWMLWMNRVCCPLSRLGEENCDPLFMAAPRACQFACK